MYLLPGDIWAIFSEVLFSVLMGQFSRGEWVVKWGQLLESAELTSILGVVMGGVIRALIVLIDSHPNWLNTEGVCSSVMEGDSDGVSHLCPNDRT